MIARANTTVSVLRGTSVNDDGDEVDNASIAGSAIPASLLRQRVKTITEAGQTPKTVEYFVLRMPRYTTVHSGDLIGDEPTGQLYIVDTVTRPNPNAINMDQRVDLRRIQDSAPTDWPLGTPWNPFTIHIDIDPGDITQDGDILATQDYVDASVAAGGHYEFVQIAPANPWVVTHNLNGYPNVVLQVGGEEQIGDITFNSPNQLTIAFAAPQSGRADLYV